MNQGIETRLRRLEDNPCFKRGIARMSEDELDAAIMDGLRTVAAPYDGDVAALVDALNASGDSSDRLLAERIVWVVDIWHDEGVPVQ